MQRLAAPTPSVSLPSEPATTCPVCGDPVRGIETTRPGEHRFVGCDHYASARFLRSATDETTAGTAIRRLGS